ncbi:MAG: hypothetical protein QF816_03230 [Candidatus Scalindua sp.]|nr:hypothetical protein [Candidatus Scalindua sp.]
MRRLTTYTMLAFFLGAFIFGLNAFAGKSVDWPGFAEGASKLAVIEGTIKSIDLEKNEICFEKCELLGDAPLMITEDTACYIGDEVTNIMSIRGGTEFKTSDKFDISDLEAGDYIKCNFSRKDGKYEAVRIIYTIPFINITGG